MKRKKEIWFYLFLYLIGIIYYQFLLDCGIGLKDEGSLVYIGSLLQKGKRLNEDFFWLFNLDVEIYSFLLDKLGNNLLAIRHFWQLCRPITALLLLYIATDLYGRKYGLISFILALLMPGPWNKTLDMLFLSLLVFLLYHFLKKRALIWIFLAGFITSIQSLFTLISWLISLVIFSASLLWLALKRERLGISRAKLLGIFILAAIGFSLGFFPFYFNYFVLLPRIFEFKFPFLKIYSGFNYFLVILFANLFALLGMLTPTYSQRLHILPKLNPIAPACFLVSLFLLGYFIFYKRRGSTTEGSEEREREKFLLMLSLISFLRALSTPDLSHLVQANMPLNILWAGLFKGFNAFGNARRGNFFLHIPRKIPLILLLIYLLFPAFDLSPYYTGAIWILREHQVPLLSPTTPIFVSRKLGYQLNYIYHLITSTTSPDDKILALPYHPMFYFMCQREAAGMWLKYDATFHISYISGFLLEQLKKDKPRYIIVHRIDRWQRMAWDQNPFLAETKYFIKENYFDYKELKDFIILKLKDEKTDKNLSR